MYANDAAAGAPAIPQTPAADLPDRLPELALLLDVREDVEWAAGHAPEALHIPLGQLSTRVHEVTDAADVGQVAVVCKVGARSQQAAMLLAASGVAAINIVDGMLGWERAGRPMINETGAEPAVI